MYMKVKELKKINNMLTHIVLVLYVLIQLSARNVNALVTLTISLIVLNYYFKDMKKSILCSIVITMILDMFSKHSKHQNVAPYEKEYYYLEGFENNKRRKKRKSKKRSKKKTNKSREKFENKMRKVKQDLEAFEQIDNEEDLNEDYMDLGTTFMEAYKSLSPKQLEAMTNDTKELIGTQQKLIETLSNLGPAISGGKKIMEQFKHYFKDEL